ncbi:30S ribosomal protein S8 [Candidatus Wolfebacteria bacterium]|nr:MAG: 30S ribosomal protein S8 [Candidatus Wolfebacteria bacterium]
MDRIADMIIMIKNGSLAEKEVVVSPYSKVKHAIANCLKREGYLSSVKKVAGNKFPELELGLVQEDKKTKIINVKRISKPSRRIYFGVKDIHKVKNGFGRLVLSTPKGILTGNEARKELVGGEALFNIW